MKNCIKEMEENTHKNLERESVSPLKKIKKTKEEKQVQEYKIEMDSIKKT